MTVKCCRTLNIRMFGNVGMRNDTLLGKVVMSFMCKDQDVTRSSNQFHSRPTGSNCQFYVTRLSAWSHILIRSHITRSYFIFILTYLLFSYVLICSHLFLFCSYLFSRVSAILTCFNLFLQTKRYYKSGRGKISDDNSKRETEEVNWSHICWDDTPFWELL